MRAPAPTRLTLALAGVLSVLALSAGATQATPLPPLPSATTEGTAEVTYNAATLSGTVIPGGVGTGSETRWCFQYGTGPNGEYNLGSVPLVPGNAGQGTSGVPVSVHLGALQPGSTYRYRLVAVNALGMGLGSTACGTEGGQEATGSEALFTTPATLPPPLVTTGAASGVSQNAATISGTVDPEGYGTSYEFQLGLDSSYGAEVFGAAGVGTEPQEFTLALTHLQAETTYHYRLVAINQAGTSYGTDAMFTTSGYPTETLTAPPSPPLLATPVFAFPTTTGTSAKQKAKVKKRNAKNTRKKTRKARKAGKTSKAGARRRGVAKRRGA